VEVATMSAVLVDYRVEHGIAIFELNNPPANTYSAFGGVSNVDIDGNNTL
jgi:hypothetical protein